jgi:very-short-patch-repair endonuclease
LQFQQRLGVDNPSKFLGVIQKIAATKQLRYADPAYNNRAKATNTVQSLYGVDHYSRHLWSNTTSNILLNASILEEFADNKTVNQIADLLNVAPTTVRNKLYDAEISNFSSRKNQYEHLIEKCLIENNVTYQKNNRKILNGLELDFYLPDYQLAIEVNGIFWHSESMGKDRSYHLNKTTLCNNKDIQLLHFWDYQIDNNPDLVLSMINHTLGLSKTKIGARQTQVRELSATEYTGFLKEHHLQKSVNSKVKLGLYFKDSIVAVMGFGSSRFKRNEYELHRFAVRQGVHVSGGASRLFKAFLNKYCVCNKIISYADRDISQGRLYAVLGFKFVHSTPPSYFYFKGRDVFSRQQFQKHKLADRINTFNPALTEWQNMQLNNFNRFWTTGNFKYEYTV